MKQNKTLNLIFILLFCSSMGLAQEKKGIASAKPQVVSDSSQAAITKPQKSVTHGSVTVEGKLINYTAVTGTLILKDNDGKPTCSVFYVAYFKDREDADKRPITFAYNGGPGSSTLWLHMGAWGPRLAYTQDTQRVLPLTKR